MYSADVSACPLRSSDSALTSLFVLHLPPLLVRLFVLDVATVKQLTIRDLWESSDRVNNTHIQHVLLYLPHAAT